MKQTALAVLMIVFFAAQAAAEEGMVLKEQMEKESYATGVTLVRNLKQQGGSFDLELVIKGMKDEVTGEKLLLTEEDLHMTLTALQSELKKHQTRGVIEYPEAPTKVRTPVRDEEQTMKALAVASIAPPREPAQQIPASSPLSFQTPAMVGASVQEHTFAALAAQQQPQTNDSGTSQIVLSDLTRMHADYWLKTLPRPKQK
jgi:hypothetical protein